MKHLLCSLLQAAATCWKVETEKLSLFFIISSVYSMSQWNTQENETPIHNFQMRDKRRGERSGRGRKSEGKTGYPHKEGALKQLLTLSSIPTNRSIIIYISIICLYKVLSEHFQSITQIILLPLITSFLPSANCRKEAGYNHWSSKFVSDQKVQLAVDCLHCHKTCFPVNQCSRGTFFRCFKHITC